jgi:hypothetical protein
MTMATRRSGLVWMQAVKSLVALLRTLNDVSSSSSYSSLIARFGEREPTVRVEVWATYTALLKQTKAALVKPPPEPDPEPFVEEGLTSAALVCLRRAV